MPIPAKVYVQHGGIEMGQGLHTKMMQIAAEVLQIPLEKCHTYETSTNTIANATATAASFSLGFDTTQDSNSTV